MTGRGCAYLFLLVPVLSAPLRRISPGPPIILVPGDGGSQIEAKIDRSTTVHYLCKKKTNDFFDLWLNLEELAPLVIDCFVDNMKMTYNLTTRRSENNEGVETRVPGWGNTSSVEWLDPSQAWKDKFIQSYISIAGPWGGSAKVMLMLASGYNLNHWRLLLPPSSLRPEQRSMTSTPFLMPSSKFWGPDEPLVITAKRNYTTGDYEAYYKDIGFPVGWEMYKDSGNLIHDLTPPGVEVHCLYGTKLETPAQFIYAKGYFPDYQPTTVMTDGDGTVSVRSAQGCLRWRGAQKAGVYSAEFAGQEHLDMMQDPDLLRYIKAVLSPSRF